MFDFFISDLDRIELYEKALKLWGKDSQLFMVMEEMAEAIKELCHLLRGRITPLNLAYELADAIIIAEQLAVIMYFEAVEQELYHGSLADFLGQIDEQYEQQKGKMIKATCNDDSQRVIADLIRDFRQIMGIANDMLIPGLASIERKIDHIIVCIPSIWVALDVVAMAVFQDIFSAKDSLPAGRGFAGIVVRAGQQKLAYLAFMIKEAEKERKDENAEG